MLLRNAASASLAHFLQLGENEENEREGMMKYKKVLVVDDNLEILELVTRKLRSEGFEVSNLSQGEEVLRVTKEFKPDLILMDIVLEDIDGADAVRRLQEDAETQEIPVIFLSGIVTEDEDEKEATIKVGDRMYPALGKPFSFNELMEKME